MNNSQEIINKIEDGDFDAIQYKDDIKEIISKSEETIQSEKNIFKLVLSSMMLKVIIEDQKRQKKDTEILDQYFNYLNKSYELLMYKNL